MKTKAPCTPGYTPPIISSIGLAHAKEMFRFRKVDWEKLKYEVLVLLNCYPISGKEPNRWVDLCYVKGEDLYGYIASIKKMK